MVAVSHNKEKLAPIQSFWIGGDLGELERLSVSSFLFHGHPYHLYTYQDLKNVPPGVQLMNANQIIPFKEAYKDHRGSWAPFSDWFRCELLYKKGGYWMDMDMVCLRKIELDQEIVIVEEAPGAPNMAVLKFPKQHPYTKVMAHRCHEPALTYWRDFLLFSKHRTYRSVISSNIRLFLRGLRFSFLSVCLGKKAVRKRMGAKLAGPRHMKNNRQWQYLSEYVLKPKTFYPVHCSLFLSLLDETYQGVDNPFPNSYAVHFYKSMMDRKNKSRQLKIHPDSFYAKMKRRYL